MKKQLLLFVVMMLPLTASADAVEINGIYYNLIEKAKIAEVTTNPNDYEGDIIIPEKVTYSNKEYDVKRIGASAFSFCFNLNSVQLPECLQTIGDWAFVGCWNLTNINIPEQLSSIGQGAFDQCQKISSVELPDGLVEIGGEAFRGCTSLTTIEIPNNVNCISYWTFKECINLKNITFPLSITTIEYGASSGCSNLTSIIIPEGISELGDGTFEDCTALTTITIPNSVQYIHQRVFERCSSLSTVIVGSNCEQIIGGAFAQCTNLSDLYCFSESVPVCNDNIYGGIFEGSYINFAKLHVPASSVSAYSSAAPWSGFGTIDAITSEDITIGDLGIGTFCGSNPLDLSGTEDVKAYVVSSYESATGQVTLTRTYYIPPFTGVVVKGSKGTHTIPAGVGQPVYPNMMKGVTTNTALNKVNGDYTNYVLANKGGNLGFYAVSDGSTLGAGKAYLPLPTADLPTAAREFTLIFDDGETTEIMKVASQEKASQGYYDLQGRRVANPTSGLYIVNGKKVIIK